MSSLLLRADAGAGLGHLSRMHALAAAWQRQGGPALVLAEGVPPLFAERLAEDCIELRTPDEEEGERADWAAIDGYDFGDTDVLRLRRRVDRVLAIADGGLGPWRAADLVVDQNLGALGAAYPGVASLCGPSYALLRREFAEQHELAVPEPDGRHSVALLVGGEPAPDVAAFGEAVEGLLAREGIAVVRVRGRRDVAAALTTAHVAVSAAGTTVLELCCLGIPAVLTSVAANQRPVAHAAAALGAAVDVGPLDATTPSRAAAAAVALLGSTADRAAMREAGRGLVDGLGASRVCAHLRSALLALRPATMDDARLLWEWANDTDTRRWSFTSEPIPWDTHVAWLSARLTDPRCQLLIADVDGQPIGQVRFELDPRTSRAEVSVSLAPAARGQGWGTALIVRGTEQALRGAAAAVVARIRADNHRSIAAFRIAGYAQVVDPDATHGADGALLYIRQRDGTGP